MTTHLVFSVITVQEGVPAWWTSSAWLNRFERAVRQLRTTLCLTTDMTHLTFPNETGEYRSARNALLAEEIALRKKIEAVAALRQQIHNVYRSPIERRQLSRKAGMPKKPAQSSTAAGAIPALTAQHRSLFLKCPRPSLLSF
jgi:hypothetical protein